jgi:hypothetical protein
VSLNNRIYLRDHRLPEHEDSVGPQYPDGARLRTMTPLQFALPDSQPNRISSHFIISRPVEPDNGRGDDTSTESPVVRAIPVTIAIRSDRLDFAI